MKLSIALDAMGGDHGPVEIIPAALHALKEHSELHFILVGQEDVLKTALEKEKASHHDRIEIQHASELVEMHEKPSKTIEKLSED